jgi:hypothetical protein
VPRRTRRRLSAYCGALRSAGVVRNSVTDITGQGYTPGPDLNETSWKAFAGVRPLEWLAMQADYVDLGSNTVGERLAACAEMMQ